MGVLIGGSEKTTLPDDGTGTLCEAFFLPNECSFGYLKLLKTMVTRYGIPLSIYQDRHGSLHRNDDNWTLEEQLNGEQDLTQVGAALKALGITPIFSLTPQAKGRVERLIAELEFKEITDMDAGNHFLNEHFIDEYNRRFGVAPERAHRAWRRVPTGLDTDRAISFHYQAVVGNDNAVRFEVMVIDIPEGPQRRGYAQAKVEVDQLLDGSWRVYYEDRIAENRFPICLTLGG